MCFDRSSRDWRYELNFPSIAETKHLKQNKYNKISTDSLTDDRVAAKYNVNRNLQNTQHSAADRVWLPTHQHYAASWQQYTTAARQSDTTTTTADARNTGQRFSKDAPDTGIHQCAPHDTSTGAHSQHGISSTEQRHGTLDYGELQDSSATLATAQPEGTLNGRELQDTSAAVTLHDSLSTGELQFTSRTTLIQDSLHTDKPQGTTEIRRPQEGILKEENVDPSRVQDNIQRGSNLQESETNLPNSFDSVQQLDSIVLTTVEADRLESNIHDSVSRQKLKTYNLRYLFETGKRESILTLTDIHDLIFTNRSNTPTRFPALTLNVKLSNENRHIQCLLDSGSNHNCIEASLVKNLQVIKTGLPRLLAADNKSLKIIGRIFLPMTIRDEEYLTEFLVIQQLAVPLLLGNKWMFTNNVEINYKDKIIKIHKENHVRNIPMCEDWYMNLTQINTSIIGSIQEDKQEELGEVRTGEQLTIGPRQHFKFRELTSAQQHLEVEQNANLRERKRIHVYIGGDLDNNKKYIHLYNASSTPKVLRQNTLVGYFRRTDDHVKRTNSDSKLADATITQYVKVDEPTGQGIVVYDIGKHLVTDKNGEPLLINPDLTVEQHNKLADMLQPFLHLFTSRTDDVTFANVEPVRIQVKPNTLPVYKPPFRQSSKENGILQEKIESLLNAGVLEEAQGYSEYQSPIFIVTNKSNNSSRMVTDFRGLNEVIKVDRFPIPSMDMVLGSLRNSQYITTMDLKDGFFQVKVDPRDRHLLTVASETGRYAYKSLPQGLASSSAIFQRIINKILSPHLYRRALAYVDDVCVFGHSYELALDNLKAVLSEFDKFNITLSTKKTKIMYNKLSILGHEVSKDGIKPMGSSIEAISKISRPKTIRELRAIIGLFSFFRKFVKDFATICLPLTDAIKGYNKTKMLQWNQDCENALENIKRILTNPPLLRHSNPDWENRIYTDSSSYAIGCLYAQVDPVTQQEHPISYFSRKLKPSQLSLSIVEKEFLSLCASLNHFREYVYGKLVHCYVDNHSLIYYKNFKGLSSRLARMAIGLVDFEIEMHFRRGKHNNAADYLSRHPLDKELETEELGLDMCNTIVVQDIADLQKQDEELKNLIQAIQTPQEASKKYRKMAENFVIQNDILYQRPQGEHRVYKLALPLSVLPQVLKDHHDSPMEGAHGNSVKTFQKINEKYYCKNLRKHVEQYVATCDSCQKLKTLPQKRPGLLNPIPPTVLAFSRLQIDVIGPLVSSNRYRYILSITCASTKYAFTFPLVEANAKSVAKCLLQLVLSYGVFNVLQSDRGTTFTAQVIDCLIVSLGSCQVFASAYTPQAMGLVESLNKTIVKALSHYVQEQPNTWSQYLQSVTFAYNNTHHSSHKKRPSTLFLGFSPQFPSDTMFVRPEIDSDLFKQLKIFEDVRKTIPGILAKEQLRQKHYYDKRHRELTFKPGDEVLIWFPKLLRDNQTKYCYKYKGPYTVLKKLTPVSYEIELIKNNRLVRDNIHVSRLKPYYTRGQ